MPKRTSEDKIKHYQDKIRRIQENRTRTYRRLRIIDSDSEEESEGAEIDVSTLLPCSDEEPEILPVEQPAILSAEQPTTPPPPPPLEQPQEQSAVPATENTTESQTVDPELDPELLQALGESVDDTPEYGSKIHDSLAKIWLPLLKKGLTKEIKEKLLKEYPIPENCKLLQAPKLNAEISAAVPEIVRNRDKTLLTQQQQLGSGVTAVNRGIDLLLRGDDKKQAIQHISNGCRILSDLHAFFTQNRIKLLSPSLDKTVLHIIQESERDESLFGNKLSDNIKAAKTIQRQGQQIKKPANPKSSNSSQPQTQRNSGSGNWNAPHRYPSNRGNRGGSRRGSYQNRRQYQNTNTAAPSTTNKPSATASKPRAPTT